MTTNSVHSLSRQELYELVWSTPMSRLAPQFGLSDVGLAKVCKKYATPRPPVGYWAKKPAREEQQEAAPFRSAYWHSRGDSDRESTEAN